VIFVLLILLSVVMSWMDNWAVDWPVDVDIRVISVWPCYLQRDVKARLKSMSGVSCGCRGGDCLTLRCSSFAANIECGGRCVNRGCRNDRMQRRKWGAVQVYETDRYGLGLRAKQSFSVGDFVLEYVGVVYPCSDLPDLVDDRRYVVDLGYGLFVDAARVGGLARYINHSCEPNCGFFRWICGGLPRVGVFALTDVACGSELTVNYGMVVFGQAIGFSCKCHKCSLNV
jgi:SET domain